MPFVIVFPNSSVFTISKLYEPIFFWFLIFNVILFSLKTASAFSLPVPDTSTLFTSYPVPTELFPFVTVNINSPINVLYLSGASTSLTVIVSAVFMSSIFIIP